MESSSSGALRSSDTPTVYHDLVQKVLLGLLQDVCLQTTMHVWFSAMVLCCIFDLHFVHLRVMGFSAIDQGHGLLIRLI